jgi:transcriptional antiterminator NusG
MSETTAKWYSLRVISGKEKKIKEKIDLEISRNEWNDVVLQVIVPIEKVYKMRNGKKQTIERNILPGYILVEAIPEKIFGRGDQCHFEPHQCNPFPGKKQPDSYVSARGK